MEKLNLTKKRIVATAVAPDLSYVKIEIVDGCDFKTARSLIIKAEDIDRLITIMKMKEISQNN